ncbi:MAG: YacP-like NYN domain-containing protein [Limisphaerales bacterium]
MALVRIMVDGYSLLHGWPELAPGKPRHSAAARDELIRVLTHYRDVIHTSITIVFDGTNSPAGIPQGPSAPEMEVLFSAAGQTADQVIERVTHRMTPFGEVLVVTDDFAERDTVINLGGLASSCASFVHEVNAALTDLQRDVRNVNARERRQFNRVA